MSKRGTLPRITPAIAIAIAIVTAAAGGAAAGAHPAAGHPRRAQAVTVQLWLSPKLAAAERFATAVSTPGNPRYRDYLTPRAYASRFGATPKAVSTVTSWLRSHAFRDIAANRQRDFVTGTGTTAMVKATFGANLAVPSRLAADVLGVTGADATVQREAGKAKASGRADAVRSSRQAPCSQYWGQHTISGLPSKLGTTTFPVIPCGYTGAQLRSAYGENSANTGRGQTIAFAAPGGLEPHMFKTLQDFAAHNHLPAPSANRYRQVSLQPTSCTEPDNERGEEQMDIEAAYSMAPKANIVVVGGDACSLSTPAETLGDLDTDLAVVDGDGHQPLASVLSDSDEYGYDNQARDIDDMETAVLVKGAAVGIGVYYSAGDQPCIAQPASNPYATDVGGTTLAISASGARLFETGGAFGFEQLKNKAWGQAHYVGFGGGESLLYKQPAYQKGVVPSSMSTSTAKGRPPGKCEYGGGPEPRKGTTSMRSAPDVSAEAMEGMQVGVLTHGRYDTIGDGNTSLSAPLVAGMVIAAQQGQAKPFGFLNPALYKLAGTPAFYDPAPLTSHDPVTWRVLACPATTEQCGSKSTYLQITDDQSSAEKDWSGQVTAPGYDNTTGLGVPNGQDFITAIRALTKAASDRRAASHSTSVDLDFSRLSAYESHPCFGQ
jgi:subtilase family serine protease